MERSTEKNRLATSSSSGQQANISHAEQVSPGPGPRIGSLYKVLAICGLLLLAIALVFGQTVRFEFVNIDDNQNVYENSAVVPGVTWKGIAWTFLFRKPPVVDYWRPLSFLSHMLDCQMYGLWAGGHHLTNVLLHAAAVLVLLLLLLDMGGGLWRSAFVAAMFAIHPLRVESVAWVTERKDVLGALFFLLTLWAYVGYARRPAWGRYGAVAGLFGLGLMCKPTLVPLPLVLMLLDYWPLGRLARGGEGETGGGGDCKLQIANCKMEIFNFQFSIFNFQFLLLEKLPLLALAAGSCLVSVATGATALHTMMSDPLSARAGNALVCAAIYVRQMFWPAALTPWYPKPQGGPAVWDVVPAVAGLAAVSVLAVALRRRQPWLMTGWFWYLAMLAPTLSMPQARMDRITYLSQIGLCLALTWAVAEAAARRHGWRPLLATLPASVLTALIIVAHAQTAHWRDSESLWTHTLACTSRNTFAHNNLGLALAGRGEVDKAIAEYRKALQINPDHDTSHINLGAALAVRGQADVAIAHFQKALEIKPDSAQAHYNLGLTLADRGQVDAAVAHFREALDINPEYPQAHNNLGGVLSRVGRFDEAIDHFQQALKIDPHNAAAHSNLAIALSQRERTLKAIAGRRKAVRLRPNDMALLNDTAWMLATNPNASVRNGGEAVSLAERALKLSGGKEPAVLDTLAAAYAEVGRFADAEQTAHKALDLAEQQNRPALAESVQAEIRHYETGTPLREPPQAPSQPR